MRAMAEGQDAALAAERDGWKFRAESAESEVAELKEACTQWAQTSREVLAAHDAAVARAERLESAQRVLVRQVRATYGIIHEGLHGGKPTDPEHQEACEMPSCRNARAVLAGSREQAAGDGA